MGKAKGPRKSKEQKEAEAIAAPLQDLLEQFKNTLGSLEGLDAIENLEQQLNPEQQLEIINKEFVIDTDKIESLEDVKEVIKAMQMRVYWYSEECPEKFKTLYDKGLLKEVTDEEDI